MTDRYFERWWEESYYIFDSETISEKEFNEKVEYEDYQAFADSMTGAEVLDRLNYLQHHKDEADKLIAEGIELAKENRAFIQLLEKVRHELTSLTGLYAYDGECKEEDWQLDFTDLISEIDKVM